MIARCLLYDPNWKPGSIYLLPPSYYWFEVGSGNIKWIQDNLQFMESKTLIIWDK